MAIVVPLQLWVTLRGKTRLQMSSLSYSLFIKISWYQLSTTESPEKIGTAVPDINRNKQTDKIVKYVILAYVKIIAFY